MSPRFWLIALAALVLVAPLPAVAQQAEAPQPAAEEPEQPEPPPIISPTNVLGEAEKLDAELRRIDEKAAPREDVEALQDGLAERQKQLDERVAETEASLEKGISFENLRDLEQAWSGVSERIAADRAKLTERAQKLQEALDRLAGMRERWELSKQEARKDSAPKAIRDRIARALSAIASTEKSVRGRRNRVLEIQTKMSEQDSAVVEISRRLDAARLAKQAQLLERDSLPLLELLAKEAEEQDVVQEVGEAWRREIESLASYAAESPGRLFAHAMLFVLLLAVVVAFRRRAAKWALEDESFEAAARILARPVSAALVPAILAGIWIHARAPSAVGDVLSVAVLIPVLRILPGELFTGMRAGLIAIVILYMVDRLRTFTDAVPVVDRTLLALESLGGIAFLAWMLRPSRLRALPEATGWLRAIGLAARLAVVLLAVALLSNLVGNSGLATLLVRSTLLSFLLAVVLYATARVLDGLVSVGFRTRAARSLLMVRNHGALLRRRALTGMHIGLVAVWAWQVLQAFGVHEAFLAGVRAALFAKGGFGNFQISLADVLAFGLAVWGTFLFSRFVRFSLNEDVLPRLSLPRGVPYAVSYIIHYAILFVGFLVAAAAAGVDLGRFAILAGALGVGIGFGLQNIVNNFMSGLILLFERPIQVGDTVQLTDLFGDVKRIGIRSSTIRTWQGAEVIVPNAALISEQVTNWTLSDSHRRMEIPVGVAYGTDPERVIPLLIEAGKQHPEVLPFPEPWALFLGFGESSLDFELRVWTTFDRGMTVKSEVSVGINRALKEAGIEIPFPQRDLHVRSVSDQVAPLVTGEAPPPKPEKPPAREPTPPPPPPHRAPAQGPDDDDA